MEELSTKQTEDSKGNPKLSHEEQFARIKEICQVFELTNDQLLNIKESLLDEIQNRLKEAVAKCWPTYVREFPCGCEYGMFLVLELRENNFHIFFMHLKGSHNYHYEKETHEISMELLAKGLEDFFDYLVEHLRRFLKQHSLHREQLNMSLCVKKMVLQNLGNNLNIPTLQEKEVVELLQDAIRRTQDLRVSVESILCNSTAILLANSWHGEHCKIAVNIGTECSAVYVERVSEIESCSQQTSLSNMIVNTEWSEFGANGNLDQIRTEYDEKVDQLSWNKDQHKFEKLISGLYLGELARQVFLQCINEAVLFEGYISQALKRPFSFTSQYVSDMLSEDKGTFEHMRLLFDKLGISKPEEYECSKVHYVLHSITQRSAHIVACGIASLMERISDKHIAVALGGSFYFNSRIYHGLIEEKLKELLGKERTFDLKSFENSVAIGSALLVAISKSKEFVYQSEEMTKLLKEIIATREK